MNTQDKIKHLEDAVRILEGCDTEPDRTTCRSTIDGLKKIIKGYEDPAPARPKSFVVEAVLRSDDDNVSDRVEAADWLSRQDDETLAFLCEDTGANDTTDDLYWELDGEIGDNDWGIHVAARLGRYLTAINESNTRDTVGFSVRLDEDDLHAWVKKNRPEAWALYEKENG